ncbi:restriction endonuclease subunit S [Andreprevotia chitinilytica]|uniref:restriction endonuclease subunit S n=1 Tax=Andreprevotia chitinilytica TaxID=396808 RepID=UPI00068D0A00|nr:restriction endonuclease subunit S [Andreprevotia chitinilytica]
MGLKPVLKNHKSADYPAEWRLSRVGVEFEIQLGKMLDSEKNVGVSKPYLGNKSVQWGSIDVDALPTMSMSNEDLVRFRLKAGDLLVCEGGEVGRAAIWNEPIDECYYQKALHRLRPLKGFSSRLLLQYFGYWTEHGLLANYVTQTSIAHLAKEKLAVVPLPVPDELEQEAIATVLSDIDALISGLDQLIAKKRDIKQAAMQQLLTGKTRLPGFDGEWQTMRLGDVALFHKGKGLPKSALNEFGSESCIHYGELFTKYSETIQYVNGRTDFLGDCFRSIANDVLMPTSDVTPRGLAKASCLLIDDVVLGGDILIVRVDAGRVCGTFLSYVIRYEEGQILQLVSGSTVFHLYAVDMKEFIFSSPSLAEQQAIVDFLSDMDAEITILEQRRNKARQLKQGMMQQLLTGQIRLI